MWTLCMAWALCWLHSDKDAPREASWLFLTCISCHFCPPDPRGGETESTSCWGYGELTLKTACWVGDVMNHLDHLWNRPSAMHWCSATGVYFLCIQSLLWTQAILQSSPRGLSDASCCFHPAASPHPLMFPHPLLQGRAVWRTTHQS